ncbi:MAG: histidinol-phosphate aminotransferase family protein [Bryobacteraceae bacterium]|nr:histidinol-phosphate aminotransferase family protein [Bryobacteraceae bacterium]
MTVHAYHGGASFAAIGVDMTHLERAAQVITADVLDAWFDPAPAVLATLREHLPFLLKSSPPSHAEGFVQEVARRRGVPPGSVLPGAGSSSLLFACLPRMLEPGRPVAVLEPMYSEYEHIAGTLLGCPLVRIPLREDDGFEPRTEEIAAAVRKARPQALLVVNPNNPTGRCWPREELLALADAAGGGTLVVVDETYLEFAGEGLSLEPEAAARKNLVVVKSMSKVYALSGARVGYMVLHPEWAAELEKWIPPWPVGLLSQAAAMEALRHPEYYRSMYDETRRLREEFRAALRALDPLPSCTNYFLIRPPRPAELAARLREEQIYVREFFAGPLAGKYLRITVRSREENRRMIEAMQ